MRLTPFHPRPAYRLLLLVHVVGSAVLGLGLLTFPAKFVTGPTTAVLYEHIPRQTWGMLFFVAVIWLLGAVYYDELWFGIPIMLGVQATFAVGLAWVIIATRDGSMIGPLSFLMLAGTMASATLYQRRA